MKVNRTYSLSHDNVEYLETQANKSQYLDDLITKDKATVVKQKETGNIDLKQLKRETFSKAMRSLSPPIRKALNLIYDFYLEEDFKPLKLYQLFYVYGIEPTKKKQHQLRDFLLYKDIITETNSDRYAINKEGFETFIMEMKNKEFQ